MITVFKNADFISFDEDGAIYSTMIVKGKDIVYLGFNTPICYDSEKEVDLTGYCVVPLNNDTLCLATYDSDVSVLKVGEKADFAIIDKNILKDKDSVSVVDVYYHGKLKK